MYHDAPARAWDLWGFAWGGILGGVSAIGSWIATVAPAGLPLEGLMDKAGLAGVAGMLIYYGSKAVGSGLGDMRKALEELRQETRELRDMLETNHKEWMQAFKENKQ